MKEPKIINVYLEGEAVSIRLVSNPQNANIIVKGDGSIEYVTGEYTIANDVQEYPKETITVTENYEADISNILIKIGMPANIKGYRYTREAIKLAINNPELINSITKELYPQVAEIFQTLPSRTERAIRHAITVAYRRGDISLLSEFFKYPDEFNRTRPTNSEFIFCIADHIRILHLK